MAAAAGGGKSEWNFNPFSKNSEESLGFLPNHTDLSAGSKGAGLWPWDEQHVRMPCSPHNINNRTGEKRWMLITKAIDNLMCQSGRDLVANILSYNQKYTASWSFGCLEEFSKQNGELFRTAVPDIIELAKQLPD